MWRCLASVLCAAMLVTTTVARSSRVKATEAQLYATLHPNTELEGNPEYGEYLEGDILVPEGKEQKDESNPLNAVIDPNRLWPNGIVYYNINPTGYSSDEIVAIENGISDLVNLTKVNESYCIQILPRQSEKDYVQVELYSGCSSYIGRIGGKQRISLVHYCVAKHGTIMHEFLHAFGFYHEQKRSDRDDWVTINWNNVQSGTENNFMKLPEGQINLLNTSYDYGSVLHYGAYAYAVDPTIPTIIPHDPNAEIGQRITLSAIDIERVQILYGCLAPAHSRFFKHLGPKMDSTTQLMNL